MYSVHGLPPTLNVYFYFYTPNLVQRSEYFAINIIGVEAIYKRIAIKQSKCVLCEIGWPLFLILTNDHFRLVDIPIHKRCQKTQTNVSMSYFDVLYL